MKINLLLFSPLLVLLFTSKVFCQKQEGGRDLERANQEDAIRRVIEQETEAFINNDSTLLFSLYADDEITQSVWNQQDGSYAVLKGKDEIRNNYLAVFKKKPAKSVMPELARTNWVFKHLSDEYAWVNFNQRITSKSGKISDCYEVRLMKKEKSGWKTVTVVALNDHSHK